MSSYANHQDRKAHDLTRVRKAKSDLRILLTEQIQPGAVDLDRMSSLEIAQLINDEDATVAAAVRNALPQIARAFDTIAAGLRSGGRLIYVGAGTSGRLGALDASEIPPTFNTDPRSVQFIMAGGPRALGASTEASEDDTTLAIAEMKKRKPSKHDTVFGIATSGRTPFTIAAIEYARRRGARTIALTCNRDSPLERASDFAIITEVGPEVLAGSSRMKAGTAHKMVLNTDPDRRHGARLGLRLRQPDGQCLDQERETHAARYPHRRRSHRLGPRNRQPCAENRGQSHPGRSRHASRNREPIRGRRRAEEI